MVGLALACLLAPRTASAQAGRLDLVTQLGGPTVAASWHDGLVFTGIGPRLVILEGCDPLWPIERFRSEPLAGIVRHVAVRDGLAYVATGRGGLNIFELRPEPRRIGHVPIEGIASKVVLQGSYAYLASGAAGMSIVDISSPSTPRVVGRFVDARGDAVIASDLAVGGSFAYVVSRNLMQVDITNPSQPQLARKVEDWADAVFVVGDRLYTAPSDPRERGERFGHLRVYDIAQDQHPPRLIAALEIGDRARRMTVSGGVVYYQASERLIAIRHDGAGGLSPIGATATPDSVLNLDFGGRWIWLGTGASGLRAVDVLGGIEGRPLRTVLTSLASPERVAVDDRAWNRIYVEDEGSGNAWGPANRIAIVDFGPHAPGGGNVAPRIVGSFDAEVDKGAMVAQDGYLYVGAPGEMLRVFDLRDPGSAREVAALPMPPDPVSGRPAPIWRLAVEDALLYVANDEWLRVLDISRPEAPRQVAAWRSTGGATDLAVDDRRAYVLGPATGIQTGRPSMQIVDLLDLAAPLAFASRDAIGFRGGIQASGGMVYIDGLQLIDVGDPDAPVERARIALEGRTRDTDFAAGFVYLSRADAEGGGEIRAFDVRSPEAPIETARVALVDEARDIALAGNLAYVAAQGSGLVIAETGLELPGPALPVPPTPTARPPLPIVIHLPVVSRGGLTRCP